MIRLQKTKASGVCRMTMCVYCMVHCTPVLHWLCVFPASNTCCVALPSLSRVLTLDPPTSLSRSPAKKAEIREF